MQFVGGELAVFVGVKRLEAGGSVGDLTGRESAVAVGIERRHHRIKRPAMSAVAVGRTSGWGRGVGRGRPHARVRRSQLVGGNHAVAILIESAEDGGGIGDFGGGDLVVAVGIQRAQDRMEAAGAAAAGTTKSGTTFGWNGLRPQELCHDEAGEEEETLIVLHGRVVHRAAAAVRRDSREADVW